MDADEGPAGRRRLRFASSTLREAPVTHTLLLLHYMSFIYCFTFGENGYILLHTHVLYYIGRCGLLLRTRFCRTREYVRSNNNNATRGVPASYSSAYPYLLQYARVYCYCFIYKTSFLLLLIFK